MSDEERRGPKEHDFRRSSDYVLGQVVSDVGSIRSWLEALSEKMNRERAEDQVERRAFREEVMSKLTDMSKRVGDLETGEKVQAEPRKWFVWVLRLSLGGAITALVLKGIAKVHWG